MTWYDYWLAKESKREYLEDVLIRAGLAHVVPWWRTQDALNHVDQVRWLEDRGIVPGWPAMPMEEIPRPYVLQVDAPEPSWPERVIEELTYAVAHGVCSAKEAEPWLEWARSIHLPAGNSKLTELRREFPG